MSTFTIELWRVLELTNDPGDGSTIGLDDYPFYSDGKRRYELNRKILEHYRNREIGMETIARFTHAVRRRMHEEMPRFNQFYESTLIEFDPLSTYNLRTVRDDTTEEDVTRTAQVNTANGTTTTSGNTGYDFPQTELAGNEDYASTGASSTAHTDGTSDTTTSAGDTTKATVAGTSSTTGYQGSVSVLLAQYRATIINVDMDVIDSLADCFMQVWDNGDELLPNNYEGSWAL